MMEAALAAQLAPWITPAVVIALFVWLRADIKGLEVRLNERIKRVHERIDRVHERIDRVDTRLGGVEGRLGGLEREVSEIKGKLGFIETSILGCNDRGAG